MTAGDGQTVAAYRHAVRRYLLALEAKRRLPSSATELEATLAAINERLVHAEPLVRLELVQRRRDLLAAAGQGGGDNLAQTEAVFIAVARLYSEAEGITFAAWRAEGVDARVLRAAGLAPAARRAP